MGPDLTQQLSALPLWLLALGYAAWAALVIVATPALFGLLGSLAVALALQDTLGQFFAAIYVAVDQPVRLGDYIRLGGGEEGFVERIGWRSTRLRMLQNSLIVIPNSKLATSTITNFYLPEPE